MNRAGKPFPLFNRIVVLVISSGLLIGLVVTLATAKFRNNLDIVDGFLMAVFFSIACGGIYLSLFWRNQTAKELEEEHSFPSPEQPDIPERALTYMFPGIPKSGVVFVDTDDGLIHFKDCHVPRKFLSSAQAWYSCPIGDLKGVHVFRYRGESLTVVTPTGKALIPATGDKYPELRKTLTGLVPHSQPGFSTDHPMMGMVYVAGALLGLFAGVFLTPRNAGDSTLGLFVLTGTIFGVAGIHLLVYVADRCLKTGLAQPLGFGMIGAWIGIAISSALVGVIGWALGPMIAMAATGCVLGVGYGVWKQSRERG